MTFHQILADTYQVVSLVQIIAWKLLFDGLIVKDGNSQLKDV